MNKILLYILVPLFLLNGNGFAAKHQLTRTNYSIVPSDTLPEKKKEIKDSTPKEKNVQDAGPVHDVKVEQHLNAINYSVQKRYMTKRCKFPGSNNFWDNTYYGLGTGLEEFSYREHAEMERNNSIELFAGKEFNANHSIRMSIYAARANSIKNTKHFQRFGLRANYLFNPTSYIWGYDPYRLFEGLFVTGLGLGTTAYQGNSYFYGEFNMGIQLKFHLQKQLNLFIEPKVSFYSDGVDASSISNWHKYDFGYGVSLGLTYHMKDPMRGTKGKYAKEENSITDELSFSFSLGGQFQLSDKVKEIGIINTCRPDIQISINKWISNPLGFRLSPFFGAHLWNRYNANTDSGQVENKNLQSYYYGARLEAMFDLVQTIKPVPGRHRVTAILIAGGEFGGVRKNDQYTHLNDIYIGFSSSLQIKCRIKKGYSIFLEPGYSYIPYTYLPEDYAGNYLDRMKFRDHVIRMNLGVEYDFSKFFRKKKK